MGGKGSGRRKYPQYQVPRHTNYYQAFEDFKKTPDYQRATDLLTHLGMKQPYVDNWIRSIFGAGWESTGTEIKFLE